MVSVYLYCRWQTRVFTWQNVACSSFTLVHVDWNGKNTTKFLEKEKWALYYLHHVYNRLWVYDTPARQKFFCLVFVLFLLDGSKKRKQINTRTEAKNNANVTHSMMIQMFDKKLATTPFTQTNGTPSKLLGLHLEQRRRCDGCPSCVDLQ